jgi:hypothetical protein
MICNSIIEGFYRAPARLPTADNLLVAQPSFLRRPTRFGGDSPGTFGYGMHYQARQAFDCILFVLFLAAKTLRLDDY